MSPWQDASARLNAASLLAFGETVGYQQRGQAASTPRLVISDPRMLSDASPGAALKAEGRDIDFMTPTAVGDILTRRGADYVVYQKDDGEVSGWFVLWLRK